MAAANPIQIPPNIIDDLQSLLLCSLHFCNSNTRFLTTLMLFFGFVSVWNSVPNMHCILLTPIVTMDFDWNSQGFRMVLRNFLSWFCFSRSNADQTNQITFGSCIKNNETDGNQLSMAGCTYNGAVIKIVICLVGMIRVKSFTMKGDRFKSWLDFFRFFYFIKSSGHFPIFLTYQQITIVKGFHNL